LRNLDFEAGTFIAFLKTANDQTWRRNMSEHIYKQIELTGTSKTSVEDAVQNAVTKAGQTLHNIHWFQVIETRGYVENNKIDYWQVIIKRGFRLDD
jgi:dodecin